jgi:putative FmdB family regulatory protein
MPIHDFRCPAGHVHEALVKADEDSQECPECGNLAERVYLKAPTLNYLAMGTQENVSPEFQRKFDKMHNDEKAKEERSLEVHGDYGPSQNYDRPAGT